MRDSDERYIALECLKLAQAQAGYADSVTGQGALPGGHIVETAERFYAFVVGTDCAQSRVDAAREVLGGAVLGATPRR